MPLAHLVAEGPDAVGVALPKDRQMRLREVIAPVPRGRRPDAAFQPLARAQQVLRLTRLNC